MNPTPITLNISGEKFDVVFDGELVSSPEFPGQPIDYTASCGTHISQAMLVQVCKAKLAARKQ